MKAKDIRKVLEALNEAGHELVLYMHPYCTDADIEEHSEIKLLKEAISICEQALMDAKE